MSALLHEADEFHRCGADRYVDLALMVANAGESWTAPHEAERAFAILFEILGINAPDRERLAFCDLRDSGAQTAC